jgi:hypothetical protein
MNNDINRKIELNLLIQNYLQNNHSTNDKNDGVSKYFSSFILLKKTENQKKISSFLIAYSDIIKLKRIPFFSLNILVNLYDKWSRNAKIISEIKLMSQLLKFDLSENFWSMIIRLSGSNLNPKESQKSQIVLLACMINNKVLNGDDLNTNFSIIQSLLALNVPLEDIPILKKNLKGHQENVYWILFHHIRCMKDRHVPAFEISRMLTKHFKSIINQSESKSDYISFVDILYDNLPSNFMSRLYYHEVEYLHFIYKNCPILFNEWAPEIPEKIKISELIEALFSTFIVPRVFLRNFYTNKLNIVEKDWFAHILKGHNIIHAENLPIVFTRKAAHILRTFHNENMSVTQAIIYCSVEALVNDHFYSRQVVLGIRNELEAAYWVKTMGILYQNGLSSRFVIEVMDYIENKVFIEGENLDLKRKKVTNLLADVRDWHRRINEQKILKDARKNLPDKGIEDHIIEYEGSTFEITQIKKVLDLYYEGQTLNHCVYTYKNSCFSGRSVIFSLRLFVDEELKTPLITIEIRGKQIVQTRGNYNRLPTENEKKIIQLWAKEKGLKYVA